MPKISRNKDNSIAENIISKQNSKTSFSDTEEEPIESVSPKKAASLESKLQAVKIYGWKKEYENIDVLGGTSWELEYKEVGKRCDIFPVAMPILRTGATL